MPWELKSWYLLVSRSLLVTSRTNAKHIAYKQKDKYMYVCMYVCMYVALYVHGVLWVVCIMNGFSLVCERVLSRIALLSMFYDNECIVDNFFWVKFQTSLNF